MGFRTRVCDRKLITSFDWISNIVNPITRLVRRGALSMETIPPFSMMEKSGDRDRRERLALHFTLS